MYSKSRGGSSAMRRPLPHLTRGQDGFTLVELLVVVVIIGVLVAFALPRLWVASMSAKGSQGATDMKTIAAALERYYVDNNAYPTGANGTDLMNKLRNGYLRKSTTFRNGFGRGYLYLTSQTGKGYLLIDVQNERKDDDPATPTQELKFRCTYGGTNQDRTFVIVTGPTAGLTVPLGSPWTVPDKHIANCFPINGGWNLQIEPK
jgi:type II secretion system protein G